MISRSGIVLAFAVAGLAAVGGGVAVSQTNGAAPAGLQSHVSYSVRLTHICAGALLFERAHSIGTRAGAIAVARDIRTSGGKRLRRADAVPKPPRTRRLAEHWIRLERRLTDLYASNYLRIWHEIERARTSRQRAQLPAVLRALIDEPRRLERRAAALEAALNVPDCTGGAASSTASPPA